MRTIKSFIYLFTFLIIVTICGTNVSAKTFSCTEYSVDVPDEFTADSETVSGFTSFYYNNITIGVRITDNSLVGDNIANYTETKINDVASETLDALTSQAGEGIKVADHMLTTFSSNNYPALFIVYEGSSKLDDTVYMEQYVITTYSSKYTIVLSADSKSDLDSDLVKQFTDSFTTSEPPLKQVAVADGNYLLTILIICICVLIFAAFLVFFIIIRKKKRTRSNQ